METFCALRLFIDSWRWQGVPWYLRSGKYLARRSPRCWSSSSRRHSGSSPTPRRAGRNITFASDSRPTPPSRSPRGSSAPARSSSATSANSPDRRASGRSNPLMSACWATRWWATARCSREKTRSRPPGPSWLQCSRVLPGSSLRARRLGAQGRGRAHRRGWRLAQSRDRGGFDLIAALEATHHFYS